MLARNLTSLLDELNEAVNVYRAETDVLRDATADLRSKVTIGIGLILLILIIEMAMLFGTIFLSVREKRQSVTYKLLDHNKISTINKFSVSPTDPKHQLEI
ncbi:hypothetical protein BV898_11150 [Hypsibius exemplaris]|uniref:Uncharacterized protein n=1 Tax=Hypsibius exemplaris TaxID=2072580 RepID=A0A1W0WHG4_HYPEX|nr:hypothetical protein BV898_11150 [Hypsibius exemplaris]